MKKIMKIGLICVAVLMFVACTAETKVDDEEPIIKTEMMKAVIGRGYDVTGRYAFSPEIKEAIMDYSKLSSDDKIILDNNLEKSEFKTYSGNTITSYQEKLAVSASVSAGGGVEGVASFNAEVGANFSKERYESDEYSFATSTSKITKGAYYVDGKRDPKTLNKYLTEQFISDLNNLETGVEGSISKNKFIEKYGTHIMLGGMWGARAEYHMSAKKKVRNTSMEIGAYVQAKTEVTLGIGNGSGGVAASTENQFNEQFEASSVSIETSAFGGSSEYIRGVHDSGEYNAWIESIAANPVWFDYYPESLVPIYELIGDETIKEKVKSIYNEYLAGKVIKVVNKEEEFLVEKSFEICGFTTNVQGDSEMDTENGKSTGYVYKIEIKQDGKNLKAIIDLTITEGGGENGKDSKLQKLGHEYIIPVSKNITDIKLNDFICYGKGTISGKNHGWITITDNINKEFLPDGVKLRIDSSSGDDRPAVGISGIFKIPVYHRPYSTK